MGITSLCIDVNRVLDLCREAKGVDAGIVTVVGGTQAYLNPESFYDASVDYIFEYTTRKNIKEFFSVLDKGQAGLIPGIRSRASAYQVNGPKGRNEYMLPDRRSTEKYRHEYSYFGYRPAAIMEFGIGCQKVCDFCLRWRLEGAKEKLIDLELTKKDLTNISEPTIMFIDNDFLGSQEKITAFIRLAKDLKLKKSYIMYGSVKGVIEFERYLKELADLGLKALLIGYETLMRK